MWLNDTLFSVGFEFKLHLRNINYTSLWCHHTDEMIIKTPSQRKKKKKNAEQDIQHLISKL